ncbi:hypothetical protein CLAIMM_02391 isoform 2 [Cladophialophora immunda]|nr:hypothetical protein CLAIMM_02391 isoform 2 [Cladophialophora immunda]
MDHNARHTPQNSALDLVPPSGSTRKPRRRRVQFSLEPGEIVTTAADSEHTPSSASTEPEVPNLRWAQPPPLQPASPPTVPPGASNVLFHNVSPRQAEDHCMTSGCPYHPAPESVLVSSRDFGNVRQLYTVAPNHAYQIQPPHAMASACTSQAQQQPGRPLGNESQVPQSHALPLGCNNQAQLSYTVPPGYPTQPQHSYREAPTNPPQAQQPHTLPPRSLLHAEQSYNGSPGIPSQAQYYNAAQGSSGEPEQSFGMTPSYEGQWSNLPTSHPQQSFMPAPSAPDHRWTSLPNSHFQSLESQTTPGPSTMTSRRRKRPAEDPSPGGSGGPPPAKRQHQGGSPRGGSQRAPHPDNRLAMSCWRAFRSFDKKIKDLHQGYCDQRDRDKWELKKRERDFRRRAPAMRGEYQHALDSIIQDHERVRRYWKDQLRTNERRWREIVQQEDSIWRARMLNWTGSGMPGSMATPKTMSIHNLCNMSVIWTPRFNTWARNPRVEHLGTSQRRGDRLTHRNLALAQRRLYHHHHVPLMCRRP